MFNRSLPSIVLAALLLAPIPVVAAEEVPEEVLITGSLLRTYDGYEQPHVTLTKRADNLITEVRVVCDTRDLSQRRDELRATLRNMIRATAQSPTITLGLGNEIIGTFDESNIDAVIRSDGRADTSQAIVVIKTAVSATDTFDSATARITDFIQRTPKVGRTEILRNDKWNLTIIGVERNRPQLVSLIAADAKRTAGVFGANYQINVEGLQLPISWYQVGPLDLALYIPYKLQIGPTR